MAFGEIFSGAKQWLNKDSASRRACVLHKGRLDPNPMSIQGGSAVQKSVEEPRNCRAIGSATPQMQLLLCTTAACRVATTWCLRRPIFRTSQRPATAQPHHILFRARSDPWFRRTFLYRSACGHRTLTSGDHIHDGTPHHKRRVVLRLHPILKLSRHVTPCPSNSPGWSMSLCSVHTTGRRGLVMDAPNLQLLEKSFHTGAFASRSVRWRACPAQCSGHPPLRVLQYLRRGLVHGSPGRASALSTRTEHDGLLLRKQLLVQFCSLHRFSSRQDPRLQLCVSHVTSNTPRRDMVSRLHRRKTDDLISFLVLSSTGSSHKGVFSHWTQTAPWRGRRRRLQQ